MTKSVISVENLSKAYRIGLKEEIPDTMVSALTDWVKSPVRNLKRLRRLNTFGNNGHDEDDTIWALKDVSFEVQEGEVLGIIGRNGAGKSTLLKILSRITEPTSGRAVIRGRVASLLEVGTGFHPELTGRENVYLNGTILGMTKREIDRKFDEIVDFSGVEKFLDTPIKHYSSGMKVRLAFAVAAHLDPEILIIDEVLAVGDAEFQRRCLGKMQGVAQSGRTVLFVSHDLVALQKLCKLGLLLENGVVQCLSNAEETVQRYLSHFNHEKLEWTNDTFDPECAARFTCISLCDENGESVAKITTAMQPRLRIDLVIHEYRPDLKIAFALCDSFQRPIFSSCPPDCGQAYPVSPGAYTYIVQFGDTCLLEQQYSITASLYSPQAGSIHQCEHVLRFCPELEPNHILMADIGRSGVIQKQCYWDRL